MQAMTPSDFENRFGTDQKALRRYLRGRWSHAHNGPWNMTAEMVEDARHHFRLGGATAPAGVVPDTLAPASSRTPRTAPASAAGQGLHHQFKAMAAKDGIELELGSAVGWLSGNGHTNIGVTASTPVHIVAALANIHRTLGGDPEILAAKRVGNPPTPDLIHSGRGCIIEVDEIQHFTSARLKTFELYPADVDLGYDLAEYRTLVERCRHRGDLAFAHKTAADFPRAGGRQAQRAYNDALRDLLAPTFTDYPTIRIPAPERSLAGAVTRLRVQLAKYT